MKAPANSQPLRLEVGKAYRTRDGRRVAITEVNDTDKGDCWGMVDDGEERCWHMDGRYFPNSTRDLDLVAEWDAPDADGWIQWGGGECPVPPDTVVEVKWAGGSANSVKAARAYGWKQYGSTPTVGDIIAYRIVKPAKSADPTPVPARDFSAHFGPMANLTWRDAFVLDVLRQQSCALSCILAAVEASA